MTVKKEKFLLYKKKIFFLYTKKIFFLYEKKIFFFVQEEAAKIRCKFPQLVSCLTSKKMTYLPM